MIALVVTYHNVVEHTTELFPFKKIVFIKAYIVLLLIQNVTINYLSLQHPALETILERLLCFCVCMELFLLSFLLPKIFVSTPLEKATSKYHLDAVKAEAKLSEQLRASSQWGFILSVLSVGLYAFSQPIVEPPNSTLELRTRTDGPYTKVIEVHAGARESTGVAEVPAPVITDATRCI